MYLTLYNTAQLLGWCIVLFTAAGALLTLRSEHAVYEEAAPSVRIWQGLALLETAHAAAGLVRGSALTAFTQWFGRANVLFAILGCVPEVQTGWPVPALFIAWALGDIVRYAWYAAAQFGQPPALLTWLRYTLFLALYPVGVASEVAIIWNSLPYLKERRLHSVELPNRLNWAFSFHAFQLFGLFVLYPTVFPWMYGTLLSQRRRRLGSPAAGSSKKQS